MFKVGDRLKCKNSLYVILVINTTYKIISTTIQNSKDSYFIDCEDDNIYYFSESQLYDYFYIIPILRKRKLEKLNSL